ncbi:hypothetical protein JDFnp4_3 [Fusobacterium phage JD-Fnp4]|nr:hypothetical protein JDFnp4_3 [Fusobacterium phage JD-Fnp4]
MIRRIDRLTYKSNVELIEHIKSLDPKDKLDKISMLSLLIHKPLVYLACYDEKTRGVALLEACIVIREEEDMDAYEERIYEFLKVLTTEEVNFTLLQNISASCEAEPEETAWVLRNCLTTVSKGLANDIERNLKDLIPKNIIEPIFKEIKVLNEKSKEALKNVLKLTDEEAERLLNMSDDELEKELDCNEDKIDMIMKTIKDRK